MPATLTAPKIPAPPMAPLSKPARLVSIDALRGFDMLLIVGGGVFLRLLEGKTGLAWIDWVARQQRHAPWHGFTFEDFIFPLFLFITGVSLVYSLNKGLETGLSKGDLYRKAFWRMAILIVLGMLQKNRPYMTYFDPEHIRLGSVLGRIGIAGMVTTILYLNFSRYGRLAWAAGILVAYWAALFLIPVPGYGAGDLSMEGNLVGWFDRNFLPGRLVQKIYDENGLLTQLPALCLTIVGAAAGDVLRSGWSESRKVSFFVLAGAAGIALGLLWSLHFPLNKHLWSSSFIVLTAGMSFLFLAGFYLLIDVLRYRRWAFFFQVVGLNSLTIYLAVELIDFEQAANRLVGGLYAPAPEAWHPVFDAFAGIVLVWLFLYFLYRKQIFLKI